MDEKQKRLSVRIPIEIHEKLRIRSFEENVSINSIILDALKEYLGDKQ